MSLKEDILKKIDERKLHMRPKYIFSLKVALLGLVGFFVLIFSVFIFNFIFFTIRISGHSALFDFGPRGYGAFIWHFPWALFLADALLIVLLEKLLRRFRFGYRRPVLYLFLTLLALVVSFGFILDRGTRVNEMLLHRSEMHNLPVPLRNFYDHARRPWPEGFSTSTLPRP